MCSSDLTLRYEAFFDTLRVAPREDSSASVASRAAETAINLRPFENGDWGITIDETTRLDDLPRIAFALSAKTVPAECFVSDSEYGGIPQSARRTAPFMQHPVFSAHRSETQMLRYIQRLQGRDLSLTHSMIPLGSCTMKLNATVEMMPITWPAFASLHPFAPVDQALGYRVIFDELEHMLREITGFAAVSLQPNAGSQGEYAGLRVKIGRAHV